MTTFCFSDAYKEKLTRFLVSSGSVNVGSGNPLSILSNYSAKRFLIPPFLTCSPQSVNLAPYFPSVADRVDKTTDPGTPRAIAASGIYALEYYVGSYFLAINFFNLSLPQYKKAPISDYQLFYNPYPNPDPYQVNILTINPLNTIINTNNSCENERDTGTTIDIFTYYNTATTGCYSKYKNIVLDYNPPQIDIDNKFVGCECGVNGCPTCHNYDPPYNTEPCSPDCFPFLPGMSLFTVFERANNGIVNYPYFNPTYFHTSLDAGLPLYISFQMPNSYLTKYTTNNNPSYYNPVLTAQGIMYADNSGDSGNDVGLILCGYIENVPAAYELDGSNCVYIFIETLGTSFGNGGLGYITSNYLFGVGNTTVCLENNSSPVKQVCAAYINSNKNSIILPPL